MTRATLTALAMVSAIAGASVAVASVAALIGERTQARVATILRGDACEGAAGPIYASEEDALPYCMRVRRVPLSSIGGR